MHLSNLTAFDFFGLAILTLAVLALTISVIEHAVAFVRERRDEIEWDGLHEGIDR